MGEIESEKPERTIPVQRVTKSLFIAATQTITDMVKIDQFQRPWAEVEAGQSILNEGASICLIAYVKDLKSERLLSGHFSNSNKKLEDEFAREDLKKARGKYQEKDPKKLKLYSKKDLDSPGVLYPKYYLAYLSFLERVKTMSETDGRQNLEAYLFGYHYAFSNNITSQIDLLIRLNDVKMDIQNAGVYPDQIYDYRSPGGPTRVDDTLYNGKTNEILWCPQTQDFTWH